MERDRLLRRAYDASRWDLASMRPTKCRNWEACNLKVLERNHALHLLCQSRVTVDEWSELVAMADQRRWQARLALKPKLEWYRHNKRNLEREPYLDLVKNFHHRRQVLQLRAGAYLRGD
jgi:hypothetical protein